jgi:hypothetical protein
VPKLTRPEREAIAEKRLASILGRHGIAAARTIEQKISDAGPYGQRIHPHILTTVRNRMVREGSLVRVVHANAPWFHLPNTPVDILEARLQAQLPIYQTINDGRFTRRLGQPLEIAVYRALLGANIEFYGRYKDLDAHDDRTLYQKEEPPQHIGRHALPGDERLDFIVRHPEAGPLGL